MTEDAICRAVIKAQCEVKLRCGVFSALELCTQVEDACPEFYFSPGSTRTVEGMASCLDELRDKSCDDERLGIVPACLTAGTLPDEAPCSFSSQCVSGICSSADDASCRSCQPQRGPGEPCSGLDCATGLFCDPSMQVCVAAVSAPPATEGEPCNIAGAPIVGCQGALVCSPTATSMTPVCHVAPGEGEPCPEGECAQPLICHLPAPNQPVCSTRDSCDPDCPAGSTCVSQNDILTCVPLPELGDTCDPTGVRCATDLICKSGTCAARPHRGDPCETGECPSTMDCTNGICSLPTPCP
jgi:hypothetical protein